MREGVKDLNLFLLPNPLFILPHHHHHLQPPQEPPPTSFPSPPRPLASSSTPAVSPLRLRPDLPFLLSPPLLSLLCTLPPPLPPPPPPSLPTPTPLPSPSPFPKPLLRRHRLNSLWLVLFLVLFLSSFLSPTELLRLCLPHLEPLCLIYAFSSHSFSQQHSSPSSSSSSAPPPPSPPPHAPYSAVLFTFLASLPFLLLLFLFFLSITSPILPAQLPSPLQSAPHTHGA